MGHIVAVRDMSCHSVKYGNASERLCEAFIWKEQLFRIPTEIVATLPAKILYR